MMTANNRHGQCCQQEDENGLDVLELRQKEDVGHFSERRFSRVESMDSDWGGLRVRAGKRRLCDGCKQNDRLVWR